tara:strand:- start:183 stop:695 length:513 start_codon:yes stop_codon:yes gene_type:complete
MNKLNLYIIVYIVFCACSPVETNKLERTYQSIIEIAPNQKILVSLEYVGKEPFKGKWNKTHDYVNEDTDFYNMTIKNLSDFDLRLLSCVYSLEKDSLSNKAYYNTDELQNIWETRSIKPGATVIKYNSFTHSKKFNSNILYKTYTFELRAEPTFITNSFTVPFIYKRDAK